MHDLATDIIRRCDELLSDRAPIEDDIRKLVRYVVPQEAAGWGVNPNGSPESPTVDDTARECLDNLVAGLDEMLFRRRPYEVVPKDEGVSEHGGYPVQWADYASHNLGCALEHPRCGFTVARQTVLRSQAGLGVGCLFVSERPGQHLVFKALPLSEIVIAENADGITDTLFHSHKMTVRQVIEKWGNKASDTVQNRLERSPGEDVHIIHGVYPRWEVTPSAHRLRMPWASVYLERDTKNILDEGGFMEFPFPLGRWDRRASGPYGWCPGMTVLDEIQRINAMVRTNLKAAQRIADPEVYLPDGMFRGSLKPRRPGAVHYYDTSVLGGRSEVRQWPTSTQLPVVIEMENAVRTAIREAFFYFLLQPVQSPNMTATEWIGRQRMMARRLGAAVGRIEQEVADPMGKRAFALLVRAGAIQPPQPPWRIADFEVRFRSPLGQLKQLADAEAIQRVLELAATVAQFDPAVAQVVDTEETLREGRENFGAPIKMLRDPQVVEQARQAAAQRQQLADIGQVAMTGATVGKLVSQAQAQQQGGGGSVGG